MIKAVIFDLDGTLLDRDSSLAAFANDQYERQKSVLGHIDQTVYVERFIKFDCHGYIWKDKVYQQLVSELAIKGMPWEQLLADYLAHFPGHCIPFPNLIPLLDTLKTRKILLGMITNGYTEFQTSNIRALGIENYFDAILISEKEGLRKPDLRIFENALARLNIKAEQAIFVGDHPVNDVEAASRTGMTSIWKRNSQGHSAIADFIIDELDEIPWIVEGLNKVVKSNNDR